MSKAKARRVDYYPDEYIAGVGGVLTATEQGVYWLLCTLIMSEGEAIEQDDRRLAGLCRMRPAEIRKTIDALVERGKILRQSDGKLSQKRAQSEVEKSLNRIQTARESGANGGRPRRKDQSNQQNEKPNGFSYEKTNHQPPTTNHQPPTEDKKDILLDLDASFDAFYDAYPRHVGKGAARKAFTTACRKISPESLIKAAQKFAGEVGGKDPKYIPHPASWLNAERWDDDLLSQPPVRDDEWSKREAEIYAGLQ